MPDWLTELRLEHVHVGARTIDLRVWRDGGDSRIEIVGGDGDVALIRRDFSDAYRDD